MKDMILRIWQKWFGQSAVKVNDILREEPASTPSLHEKPASSLPMLKGLEKYLRSRYDFRFNVLTEQAEIARKGESDFRPVTQRSANTLCLDARDHGINCWDKDVTRLLNSERLADFHPFLAYMTGYPNGTASTVSHLWPFVSLRRSIG